LRDANINSLESTNDQSLDFIINPKDVQEALIDLARAQLLVVAGDKITRLVISCLHYLEGGFGKIDFVLGDPVETGLNYMTAMVDSLL
jgi:hypothetical protein